MSPLRWTVFACLPLLALVVRLAGLPEVAGQEAVVPNSVSQEDAAAYETPPVRFRRFLIPTDRLDEWRDPGVRYLPVSRSHFDRLVEIVGSSPTGHHGPRAPRLVRAHYTARFDGKDLLKGSATLHVEREPLEDRKSPDQTESSESSVASSKAKQVEDDFTDPGALLPLDPCSLAVNGAHWETPLGREVLMGANEHGQMLVHVLQSGKLHLDWLLRGLPSPVGAVRFQIEVPECPVSTIDVELNDDAVLRTSQGLAMDLGPTSSGGRRWRVELGGHRRALLAVVPSRESGRRHQSLRQSITYAISPKGLQVTAQLTFESNHRPLREVRLHIDPQLRLLAVKQGDVEVAYQVEVDAPAKVQQVLVSLAEPIQGTGRLRIEALAPVVLLESWRLPWIEVPGVAWESGQATILVPRPLMVQRLETVLGVQSGVGTLTAPDVGESFGVRFIDRQARIDLVLSYEASRLSATTANSVQLADDEITAVVMAELAVDREEVFLLDAELLPSWAIDSVESIPAGRVNDWNINTGRLRQRVLEIRLDKALTADSPLRLRIEGHRLNVPAGETLRVGNLRMLRILALDQAEQFMAIETSGPYRVRLLADDPLERLAADELEMSIAGLFERPPANPLFRVDAAAEAVSVERSPQPPDYTAEVQVETTVTTGPLWQRYSILCRPRNGQVQVLQVRFSHRRPEALRWRLGSESGEPLEARLLENFHPEEETADTGETWELNLPAPRSQPFRITATRAVAAEASQAVSLVSLPGAVEQSGDVLIRATPEAHFEVVNRGLKPLPVDSSAVGLRTTVRAMYQYDPPQDAMRSDRTGLSIRRSTASQRVTDLVIWHASLRSRYGPGRRGEHLANYWLENNGTPRFRLRLPPSVQAEGVWIDGVKVAERVQQTQLEVELPTDRQFLTVQVRLMTEEPAFDSLADITAPALGTDTSAVSQQWTIWLPPGYELATGASSANNLSQPPTVLDRLFGPLAGSSGQPHFRLWQTEGLRHWMAGAFALEYVDAATLADDWLSRFAVSRQTVESRPTWEAWATEVQASIRRQSGDSRLVLLLDWQALAKAGVAPQTQMPRAAGKNAGERGASLLEDARLALLVHGSAGVLTSAAVAGEFRHRLIDLNHSGLVYQVDEGVLAQQIELAAAGEQLDVFVRPDAWTSQATTAWQSAISTADVPSASRGWTAYRLTGPWQTMPAVRVIRQHTIRAMGWALCLLIVLLCGWTGLVSVRGLIVLLGVSATLALFLPSWCLPIGWGAVLGTIFALVVRAVRQRRMEPNPPSHWLRLPAVSDSAVTSASLLLLLLGWTAARAAEAIPKSSQAPSQKVHKVLVPVDENDQPAGNHYYVPEPLYRELRRRASSILMSPQGWLLERADYRGALKYDLAERQFKLEPLRILFDLRVFDRSTTLMLPLGGLGEGLASGGPVLLDGQPVTATWDADGQNLILPVDSPGQHRLELTVSPLTTTRDGHHRASLKIPPLATARLELNLPMGIGPVLVPLARGESKIVDGGERLVVELGAGDRLRIEWPAEPGGSGGPASLDVDELLWLKVRPGSVIVNAKFKYRVTSGVVREVRFAADSRLTLLPTAAAQPHVKAFHVTPGDPQVIRVELTQPVTDQVVIAATLQLQDAPGIGRVFVPLVEPLAVRTARRIVGVSVDPALEFAAEGTPPAEVTLAEFAAAWGPLEAPPRLAFRLPDDPYSWSLATSPRIDRPQVKQTLALGVGASEAMVRYVATITATGAATFEHRLAIPATLMVDSVSATADGVDHLLRWTRDTPGRVVVFLNEAFSGPLNVELNGRLPVQRGLWTLPRVSVERGQVDTSEIRIYRQADVLVSVRKPMNLEKQTSRLHQLQRALPDTEYSALGRLTDLYSAEEPGASALVRVVRNPRRFDVVQITQLHREGTAWQAEVVCRLQVDAGAVDVLRFDISPNWTGPFSVTPAASTRLLEIPGQKSRQLLVYPREVTVATAGAPVVVEYRIRGDLASENSSRIRAPVVQLRNARQIQQWLILPRQSNLQPIRWSTPGLNRDELPAELAGNLDNSLWETFQAGEAPFQAELLPSTRPASEPRVRLADIRLAREPDGRVHGVAGFDLDPAGTTHCPLRMPAGYQLVQAWIGGVPAMISPDGDGRWRLSLTSDQLPQHIDVAFTGSSLGSSGNPDSSSLLAPELGNVPVDATMWTVHLPPGVELAGTVEAQRVDPWQVELARTEAIAYLTSFAAEVAADEPQAAVERWYVPWARRFHSALNGVSRTLRRRGNIETAAATQTRLDSILSQQRQTAEQLGTADAFAQHSTARPVADHPGEFWSWGLEQTPRTRYCAFVGRAQALPVRRTAIGVFDFLQRLAAAFAVAAICWVLVVLSRRGWWQRWPALRYLTSLAAGIAWLLWLWPATVGWLVIALTLLSAATTLVRRRGGGKSSVVKISTSGY